MVARGWPSGPQDGLWQRWCGQTLLLLGLRARTPRHIAFCRKSVQSISCGATTALGIPWARTALAGARGIAASARGIAVAARQAPSAAGGQSCGTANTLLGKRWGNPRGWAKKARAGFGGNLEKSPRPEIKPLCVHFQPGRVHCSGRTGLWPGPVATVVVPGPAGTSPRAR